MRVEGGRTMVLVEDSDEDAAAFRRALRRKGFETEVERYQTGVAFLDAFRSERRPRTGTVVVLDLNLPVLNGMEVIREMRMDARLSAIPVVVLTTSSDPREIRRCYELGVGGYFLKEGDFGEFSDRIGTLAECWLRAVRLP